jgi:hypothetical protein
LLLITKCFDDFVIFKNVPYKRCKSGFDWSVIKGTVLEVRCTLSVL